MENTSNLENGINKNFLKNNNVINLAEKRKQLRPDIAPEFLASFDSYCSQVDQILANVDECVRKEVYNDPQVGNVIDFESERLVRKGNLTAVKESTEKFGIIDDLAA